jgi:molecular chaperone DnaJ
MSTDYYRLIGVSETATLRQIKSAYRRKMKQVHPDLAHGDTAERARREVLSKQINEAYHVLSNPVERRRYDRTRWSSGGGVVESPLMALLRGVIMGIDWLLRQSRPR